MKISDYSDLIKSLPVLDQAFTTNRSTWEKLESEFPRLKEHNDSLFKNEESYLISRRDVFESQSTIQSILCAIYWGYPRGMRGLNFKNIMSSLDTLISIIDDFKKRKNISPEDVMQFYQIGGLGISTYTKLLYFNKIHISGYESLILDNRLINVFQRGLFEDVSQLSINYSNAPSRYLIYLQELDQLSKKLKCPPVNIELFMFAFGTNLKS